MEDFKQELTENSYMRQEELAFRDCDRSRRVRVAGILNKLASYAGYDYDARELTYEKLYEMRQVFLLSRVAVKIHSCPMVRDVLEITTWENGAKAAHVQRDFEMRDRADGSLRISAKSDWILVDPVTRKILRPSTFTARPLQKAPVEVDCPAPKKIVLPHEGLEDLGERPVRWSDLDGNGHLFSGNYGDIVWDALPGDLQGKTPREFYINYSQEAKLGETLRLKGFREGDTYRMEGIGPEKTCFTALCVF